MAVHAHVKLEGAQQILKVLAAQAESAGSVTQSDEERVISMPEIAIAQFLSPIRQLPEARHRRGCENAFPFTFIREVIGVTREGIDGGESVPLIVGNQVRCNWEILVMPARQSTARRISGFHFSIRIAHWWVPDSAVRAL